MKTIRILFYTDSIALEDETDEKCVSDVRRFIALKLDGIAKVDIQVRVRTGPPVDPAVKLTLGLLKDFDELWVFGFGIDDRPEYVLDEGEVRDLCEWMTTGGVMVTGDHSRPEGNNECPAGVSHARFRSLGFSLGSRIPRAGQLRVWVGPPTSCSVAPTRLEESDTFNTQEAGDCNSDLDELCLQHDETPQFLEPMPFPPHFLFTYDYDAHGQPIPVRQFPDHAHVGHVLESPDVFDACWPARPPFPQAVAKGRDKRPFTNSRVYDLVVAYDGDQAAPPVGRIVSDASFHHFINLNLGRLLERDPATKNPRPGTALDEIAQYYANLALWLAPKTLRDEIKRDLLLRAARHIDVFETFGNGPLKLGRVAKQALASRIGAANLHRLFGAGAEEQSFQDRLLAYVITGRNAPEGFGMMAHEHLLGLIIEGYYEYLRVRGLSPLRLADEAVPDEVIFGAMENAFNAQASLTGEVLTRLREGARGAPPPEPQGGDDEGGAS